MVETCTPCVTSAVSLSRVICTDFMCRSVCVGISRARISLGGFSEGFEFAVGDFGLSAQLRPALRSAAVREEGTRSRDRFCYYKLSHTGVNELLCAGKTGVSYRLGNL